MEQYDFLYALDFVRNKQYEPSASSVREISALTEQDLLCGKMRLKKAIALYQEDSVVADRTILLLFDPDQDTLDYRWLLVVGDTLAKTYPDIAKSFILRAGDLNPEAKAKYLYQFYLKHKKDIPESIKWAEAHYFADSDNQDSELAFGIISLKLKQIAAHDDITIAEAAVKLCQYPNILGLLNNVSQDQCYEHSDYCTYLLGTFHASKRIPNSNATIALEYYHALIDGKGYYSLLSLRNLVTRYALGLGVEQDIEKSRELFIRVDSHCLRSGYNYSPLNAIIEQYSIQEFKLAYGVFREYIEADKDLSTLPVEALIDKYPIEILADLIEVVSSLSSDEAWANQSEWNELNLLVQAKKINLSLPKITNDTLKLGPFYNALAENGLPILGKYRALNYTDPDRAIVFIPSGLQRFVSVEGDTSGDLSMKFDSGQGPALIQQEDVNVALTLAFSGAAFLWPSISIDMREAFGKLKEFAQEKVWDPEWLRETDFGKTLYITDFLAGRLSWSMRHFDICDSDSIVSSVARDLKDSITSITGHHPDKSTGAMVNVNVKEVELESSEEYIDPTKLKWTVSLQKVWMRVIGGYTLETKDGQINWAFENDEDYPHCRITARLTDRYDDVALVLPVFERLRQLAGMVYCLNELRSKGFKPTQNLQSQIDANLKSYKNRYPSTPEYARNIPFFHHPQIGF